MKAKQGMRFMGVAVCLGACALAAISLAYADAPLHMSPDQIVLKSQNRGQFQDLQAIVSAGMPSGYGIAEYTVVLSLDGVEVAEAFDFRYCYIDSNYLASFDRAEVQEYLLGAYPDGGTVLAQVSIAFTAENGDGDTMEIQIESGTDEVLVLNPGK